MPLDLPVSIEQLEAAAEKYGTPLQLYDEAAIRANVRVRISASIYDRHSPMETL